MSENQPTTPPPLNPAPGSPLPPDQQARNWNMWCHLSTLSGFVIPFGHILGPLIIWQMKKNEFPSVVEHGKAAINFQITVTIAMVLMCIIAII
ncbi:MAG TPA: DUF4870 domain-containing protein, partial [Verrucomicrobiae bacterium]